MTHFVIDIQEIFFDFGLQNYLPATHEWFVIESMGPLIEHPAWNRLESPVAGGRSGSQKEWNMRRRKDI